VECRDQRYKIVNAARIKQRTDDNNHKKYNQYEEGKEQCVICEGWFWAVCHHAAQRHKVNHKDYKRLIGADVSKSRITPLLKQIKKEYVFANHTVENLKAGAPTRYIHGDKRAGNYKRSPETIARLKKQFS